MDSDSKKIISKLVKIARNQQKIIEKLSQNIPNAQLSSPPPAQELTPAAPTHVDPKAAVSAAIKQNPVLARAIAPNKFGDFAQVQGNTVSVQMKPGHNTDANYKALMAIVSNIAKSLPSGQLQLQMT